MKKSKLEIFENFLKKFIEAVRGAMSKNNGEGI